jgi:hypothetical protein
MSSTDIGVLITSSGIPSSFESEGAEKVKWPSNSNLVSAILGAIPMFLFTYRRETVFLTRLHQRVMDRAIRRSVKIIA